MAALTQPTGAQLAAVFPSQAGSLPTVGTLAAGDITAYIASDTTGNVVTTTTTYIRALIAGAGIDPDNLTALQFVVANSALKYACIYELLQLDLANRQCIPLEDGRGLQFDSYQAKMQQARELAANELRSLGITQSRYWIFQAASIERIQNCNHG